MNLWELFLIQSTTNNDNNIKHFIRDKTNDLIVFIFRMQFFSEQLMQNLGSKYILHIWISYSCRAIKTYGLISDY